MPPSQARTIPSETTLDELFARYDVFFLDAYGVLVNSGGALPGAAAFLERLEREGKRWLLVSNDASRSIDTTFARYQRFGLPIPRAHILTSGALLGRHFARAGLVGAKCQVLGTDDSHAYVRDAGGVVVAPGDPTASVCVLGDDDGYPFLETVNDVVSSLLARIEAGLETHLLLPNPDLVFPRGEGGFGITAGAIAAMIEAVLRLRDPGGVHRFLPLGKPFAPMFEAALERTGNPDPARVIMFGDQLGTDVRGAISAGIDAVLVETGVARRSDLAKAEVLPTHLLPSLA